MNDFDPRKVLDDFRPALLELWERRNSDTNTMIVIGDARRGGIARNAKSCPSIERTLFDRDGNPQVFYAYLQPLDGMIAMYERGGREIGRDLRHHVETRDRLGVIAAAVMVAVEGILWATLWRPDGDGIHVNNLTRPDQNWTPPI
jgi:hypothetical protein